MSVKLRTALSVSRDKILELKYEGFKELVHGALVVAKVDFPRVRKGFTSYLQHQGIHPNDDSILTWLQENPGPVIGVFIFERNGRIDFLLKTGTQAELKQIGIQNVEEGSDTQGASRIRKVNVG